MKVLVGVDGTETSLQAIRFATRILSPDRDVLTLFFAPPQRTWSECFSVSREDQAKLISDYADSVLAQAVAEVPAKFSRATLLPEAEHKTARALLDAAKRTECDLVVVGAGRSSHRLPFFLGGVTHSITHESDRPVLACRPSGRVAPEDPFKVLLAADMTDTMDLAVDILNQFTWPTNTCGQIIHAMDYVEDERLRHWINQSANLISSAWNAGLDQALHDERDRVRQQLNDLRMRLPTIFHQQEPILTMGHVVERIVETVEREGIDMVVVGGCRRGIVTRWLGSTTEGLLLQASASILVLHDTSSVA